MARRSTQTPVPDDFEEHILDIDVGEEMRVVLPGVRLLRHLLPRPARRPRRPEAGAAADPLHDERHGAAARPRPRQERPRRRRGHGSAAPPRRRRDLRRAGPDGPAVVDAAADDRRPRQLRLARRFSGGHALHRVPDGAAGGVDDRVDRRGHRRLQAQLRQPRAGAGRAAGRDPQPDRQRHHRHRGRHGHQHRAAQPGRGRPGAAPPDQAPRPRPRRPDAVHPGSRPAHRRQDRRPRRHPRRLRDRPRHASGCGPPPGSRASAAARASSSPSCPTASAPRRSSSGSRPWSRPRSSRASPTSRTSPTATTACGWSSRSRTASTPRRSSSSSTGRPRWRTRSASTPSRWSTASPARSGLKELLEVFLGHRFDVVRRRSAFRRGKAADRLHLVEGLLVAILDIDEVIQLIRSSDNAAAAKERLIVGLRPDRASRPTTSSTCRCAGSRSSPGSSSRRRSPSSSAPIEELDAILGDDALLRKVVSDELAEVAKTYGTPRRTVLLESAGTSRHRGRHAARGRRRPVLRLPVLGRPAGPHHATTSRPATGGGRANHDVIVSAVRTTARGEVGVLTSRGPAAQARRARPAGAPGDRQRPATCRAALPLSEFLSLEAGRAGAGADLARRPTAPDSPSAPARAWSSGSTRRCSRQRRVGRDPPRGGRRGGRRPRAGHRRREAVLRHLRRAAAALRRRRRPARRAAPAAGSPASGSAPGDSVVFFGALDPADAPSWSPRPGSSTALPGHRGRARSR